MTQEFKVTYSVDDGYAGPDRPHHLTIDEDAIDGVEDLSGLFWECIQEDFVQNCHPHSSQEAEFVLWARARQAAMEAETE